MKGKGRRDREPLNLPLKARTALEEWLKVRAERGRITEDLDFVALWGPRRGEKLEGGASPTSSAACLPSQA